MAHVASKTSLLTVGAISLVLVAAFFLSESASHPPEPPSSPYDTGQPGAPRLTVDPERAVEADVYDRVPAPLVRSDSKVKLRPVSPKPDDPYSHETTLALFGLVTQDMTQVEVQALLGPIRHTSKRRGVEENWYLPSPPLDVASFDSPFGYGAVLVGFEEGRVVSKKLNPRIQAPVVPLLEDNRDESFSLFLDPLKGK